MPFCTHPNPPGSCNPDYQALFTSDGSGDCSKNVNVDGDCDVDGGAASANSKTACEGQNPQPSATIPCAWMCAKPDPQTCVNPGKAQMIAVEDGMQVVWCINVG